MSGHELFGLIWYFLIECKTVKRQKHENDLALGYSSHVNTELVKLEKLLDYISDNYDDLCNSIDVQKGDYNA